MVWKIFCESGEKRYAGPGLVPVVPIFFEIRWSDCRARRPGGQTAPLRRISSSRRSESALTTETPTPWRPPETL